MTLTSTGLCRGLRALGILFSLVLQHFTPAATAGDLGRLFFTPDRRAALERQRELNLPQRDSLGENDMLTLNGLVTRSNGKRTIWINGTAVSESSSLIRFRAAANQAGSARLTTGDEAPISLTVGNTLNRGSGQVNSSLGNGWVRVRER